MLAALPKVYDLTLERCDFFQDGTFAERICYYPELSHLALLKTNKDHIITAKDLVYRIAERRSNLSTFEFSTDSFSLEVDRKMRTIPRSFEGVAKLEDNTFQQVDSSGIIRVDS
jgi:hypothetical protein